MKTNGKTIAFAGVALALLVGILIVRTPSEDKIVERVVEKIKQMQSSVKSSLGYAGSSFLTGLGLYTDDSSYALETIVTEGQCLDATTTLFSVANPFAATSTVSYWSVDITGLATTSAKLYMGTTTSATHASGTLVNFSAVNGVMLASASSTWGYQFITSISSSTAARFVGQLNGFLAASSSDITGGRFASSTMASNGHGQTGADIIVRPNERFGAFVNDDNYKDHGTSMGKGGTLSGYTNLFNNFACTYKIEWKR